MDIESLLYNSEGSSNKEILLRKCRDTISQLQSELENLQRTTQDLEFRYKDSIETQLVYQQEIQERNYQIKELSNENSDLCFKYENFIKKALVLQDDNKALESELELVRSRYRDCENSLTKTIELLDHSKAEIKAKSDIINEWNNTMNEVEKQMRYLSEENGYLKQEIENERLKNRELEKKIKSVEDEKSLVFKSFQETKEKLAVCKHELDAKGKVMNETQTALDEVKNRSTALEISLSEVAAKAKIAQEEVKTYKAKNEMMEKQIREGNSKYVNDMEKMNKTLENKTNFFNKEDSRKMALINRLENDLKSVKDELENLIAADCQLQARYRDLLGKIGKKKEKVKMIKGENVKLNQSLMRFEEKLKSIEAGYLSEIKAGKSENFSLLEKIRKNEKSYCDRIDQVTSELGKKVESTCDENSRLKLELSKYTSDLSKLLSQKEEELNLLNEDRQKLQHALSELESKVVSMSRNLETSVADCWRLSNELSRHNEMKKDELTKLGEYYKVKLYHKDEEFQVQNEKYTERLKGKLASIYEKSSKFKENLRKELENLEFVVRNLETSHEFSVVLAKIHSLLNSFII